jgi:POLQ-like helicase
MREPTKESSRARARTWPYPRHRYFEQELRQAAAAWFKQKGFDTSSRYRYILADRSAWRRNIILAEVADHIEDEQARRTERKKGFPLHKYIHHGLSSQAMLFNLIGPLIMRRDLNILVEAFDQQGINWPEGKVTAVFEYEDRKVFREDTGQPTSVDLVLRDSSGRPFLFCEAKLVEKAFGRCSVFEGGDCDGRNPACNLSLCYLHHLGRKYWTLLKKHGFLTVAMRENATCILSSYYQFFREVVFALELGGAFVLLYDDRNPAFHCSGSQDERGLMPFVSWFVPDSLRDRVATVTIQQVVAAVKASNRHEWIEEFERKYGLAQTSSVS